MPADQGDEEECSNITKLQETASVFRLVAPKYHRFGGIKAGKARRLTSIDPAYRYYTRSSMFFKTNFATILSIAVAAATLATSGSAKPLTIKRQDEGDLTSCVISLTPDQDVGIINLQRELNFAIGHALSEAAGNSLIFGSGSSSPISKALLSLLKVIFPSKTSPQLKLPLPSLALSVKLIQEKEAPYSGPLTLYLARTPPASNLKRF
ncbi:hypothetical protein D9758_013133 [Tetrapyrgos nigripes]|uniref:Uncharacterized protein n=1 Tax=Tetrapyrgos nigripes TaxID=182062 RepID=A0A8H5CGG9_9AGAR|nr:hypothetical protein D9758_013133 [Tetrapyrgos nigripes]